MESSNNKPIMLTPAELTKCIQDTPIEHILQTRYDICEITDPHFSPFIHNRSTIFNCTYTECHTEAYTTFVLQIMKYYCSDTFCYMIYKYIYEFLQTHVDTSQFKHINIISIIHMFRIMAIYSIEIRSLELYTKDITRSLYTPFDISFNIGEPTLGNLYQTFFDTISIGSYYSLTLEKFNQIITKFTHTLPNTSPYVKPVVLKASLNTGKTNLHSFTLTIQDADHLIISGANGAALGLCSVTQDNQITVVKFRQYLQVIDDIKIAALTHSPDTELINIYKELYHEIFLKNCIIRNIYDETGLTINQYEMIIIGIYNYIVETYKHTSMSKNTHYIEYLQSLQYITQHFQICNSEINKYKKSLRNIILKIPRMITIIENYIRKNCKKETVLDNESDSENDDDDVHLIFNYIQQIYKSTNTFNNTQMNHIIINIIQNIIDQEGIPEYFLIDQIDVKYSQSTEARNMFKHTQLDRLTHIHDIHVRLLGITRTNIYYRTSLHVGFNIMGSSDRRNILEMYTNLGNSFINKTGSIYEEVPLMPAQLILIDILDRYCKPTNDLGYKEFVEEYLNNYLQQNTNITYDKFNVYLNKLHNNV